MLDSWLLASRFGAPTGSPTISPTAFLVDYCDKLYVSGWGSNIGIGPPLTTNGLDPSHRTRSSPPPMGTISISLYLKST
ncbi:MAG: hypothetical protein IPG10_20485 [Flavobacteriales bacterium]|nr:hypothetical protein [Flavobacteriales bacterium]